jgi:hypothetical protein
MNAGQRRGWRVPVVEDPMQRIHVAATMHKELMQRLEWALSVIGTDIPVIEIPIADATPQTGERRPIRLLWCQKLQRLV